MFGRVHIVDKKVEKFAYRRAVVAPGDELLATVRLDAHRETTVWLFALLLGLLPGYLVAVLVGLTKKSWSRRSVGASTRGCAARRFGWIVRCVSR
jgi:hypothetical protein